MIICFKVTKKYLKNINYNMPKPDLLNSNKEFNKKLE